MFTSVARLGVAMHRVSTDPAASVRQAVARLRAGDVIAVPTDTVYGLAASAQDTNAIKLLYEIKARDESKPVAICVSKVSEICKWGVTSHLPQGLLKALLPGPVTVVLERSQELNHNLNPGCSRVGIRVPDDAFIRCVAREFGKPIALTSANSSLEPSSLRITEFQHLWSMLGAVFDGGALAGSRKASTVVDLSCPAVYSIVRDGSALDATVSKLEEHGLAHQKNTF